VRADREIQRTVSAGSHAFYADAPDSTKTEGHIRKKYATANPVLIVIRQNGREDKGWTGAPFYWRTDLCPAEHPDGHLRP